MCGFQAETFEECGDDHRQPCCPACYTCQLAAAENPIYKTAAVQKICQERREDYEHKAWRALPAELGGVVRTAAPEGGNYFRGEGRVVTNGEVEDAIKETTNKVLASMLKQP
jgi:hypothetical protein